MRYRPRRLAGEPPGHCQRMIEHRPVDGRMDHAECRRLVRRHGAAHQRKLQCARFADQPGSDDFRTEIANPNLIGHLGLGIDMITTASVDIKLQYDLDLASGYTANAGMLKVAYRW